MKDFMFRCHYLVCQSFDIILSNSSASGTGGTDARVSVNLENEGMVKEGRIRCADDNDLLKLHFKDAAQQIESGTSAHPRKKLIKIGKNAHVDGVAAILDALCMRANHWQEVGPQLENRKR